MSGAVTNPLVVDPLLTAEENFFAAIRGANPTRNITPAMVSYSAPVEYTHPTDDWYNTEVMLSAKPGFRLVGSVPVHYHRDPLSIIGTSFSFAYDNLSTMEQLLQATAAELGLVATEVEFDVASMPTPEVDDGPVTINLQAPEDSMLYVGSVSITFTGVALGVVRLTENGLLRLMENGDVRVEDIA